MSAEHWGNSEVWWRLTLQAWIMMHSSMSEVLTSPAFYYGSTHAWQLGFLLAHCVEDVDVVITDTLRDGHFGLPRRGLRDASSSQGDP